MSATGKGASSLRANCPACKDYSTIPLEGMLASTAKELSHNYQTYSQPLLAINGTTPDASSIWFSLETLKNFIFKIESAVCEKDCSDKLNLGIRIYYAKYPQSMSGFPDLAGVDPAFNQHHTLFMVPTFQADPNSQEHWDFDPWHWGTNNCKPTSMYDWFRQNEKPFGEEYSLIFSANGPQYFSAAGSGITPSALNHGDLIPPYPYSGSAY